VSLRRGINISDALEAPNEGDWGLTVQEEYFDLIKEAGFDFVRLPIRWNAHADESAPYALDPVFFSRIDQIVNWALSRDLVIILDFHNYDEMASDPWSHKDRFLAIWSQLAEHYKDYPPQVMFELLNEPNDQLDAALWNTYLGEALTIIRRTNPTRDIIVGPA
jgi:endoglucanase